MTYGSGGGGVHGEQGTAEKHMKRFFETQTINGVSCDVQPIDSSYWGSPLNPGWYGIPEGNPKFRVCAAVINIDDWLKMQGRTRNAFSQDEFEEGAYDPTVKQAKESIESGNPNEIPTPVLEIDYDEYQVKSQEGRSRAMGARAAGEDEIPIWVAAREYR